MKSAQDITCCVVDHGLNLGLAHELGRHYQRVLYWTPTERSFPKVQDFCLGDGFHHNAVERIQDFWGIKKDIDLFVFPDIQHAGLQLELESQGFPVWGSRHGDDLEMKREFFLDTLKELGLPVPKYEVVVGLNALRAHLHEEEDKYIKLSKFRGNFETAHWRNWKQDEGMLDVWAVEFGPLKELLRFIVMDAIPNALEVGGDTYNVRGQFPQTMLQGFEWKDKGYLGAVMRTRDMPEPVQLVNAAFAAKLKEYAYTNFWSMELRVTDKEGFPIDPCCRAPCPGLASQTLLYSNLGEIIWAGANGELVEPETNAEFSAECVLTAKIEHEAWAAVEFPESLRRFVWLRGGCEVDGRSVLPWSEAHHTEIGWLRARGNTIKEVMDAMKSQVKQLPDGVEANTESLFNLLKEVHEAEEKGMEFTDQTVPEPETALEV